MSLGCLAELVSVTSGAVRSLNNNNTKSGSTSDKLNIFTAGSPFESPRSFQSMSDKSGNFSEVELENTQPSNTTKTPSCETDCAETKEICNPENNVNAGFNAGGKSVTEVIQCTVVGVSSETQHADICDNINNHDRKLSISKTRLREIPSPREHDHNSPRSQDSVISAASKISGGQHTHDQDSPRSQGSVNSVGSKISGVQHTHDQKSHRSQDSVNSVGSKMSGDQYTHKQGSPRSQGGVNSVGSKMSVNQNTHKQGSPRSQGGVNSVGSKMSGDQHTHRQDSPHSQVDVNSVGSKMSGNQNRIDILIPTVSSSTEKVFVERHEPYAKAKNVKSNQMFVSDEMYLKKSVQSLNSSGEQPEIIDVHQPVTTITSGISQSSDDSAEDLHSDAQKKKLKSGRNLGSNQSQPGKNELGPGLKQGALNRGSVDPTKVGLFNDVYISHFGLTEKQRGLKEALAKRSESNKPKKKFVQPQLIRQKLPSDSETDRSRSSYPATSQPAAADSVVTAAAAASAAVAAAQPFLKTQYELETKMQQLLAQISELQQKAGIAGAVEKSAESENRIKDLERQVAELNERRFEHLENLQQQQMQLQAQLLFMSQSRSHNSRALTSRPFQASHIPQTVVRHRDMTQHQGELPSYHHPTAQSQPVYKPSTRSKPVYNTSSHNQPTFNPDIISKHHNYLNEVRELQGSHLDTPAPRDKVPKPAPYTLPHEPKKNFGFLQELLAPKDTADTDTTYSVMGDYSSPDRLHSDRNNSARGRRRDQSPVDKARQLVTSLSNLEKETADSIWGSRDDGLNQIEKMEVDLGPAPLDRYLKYPEKEGSPYPKLGHHSKQKKKLLESVDNFQEAKNVLRHLEETRQTLENNIDQVVRSRRDVHLFSTLLGSEPDRVSDGQLRIEKLVNKKISALEGDVQREVLRGLALAEAEKLAAQQELELATKRKLEQCKSAILKGQADRTARLSYSKPNSLATTNVNNKGKENRGIKVRLPPKPAAIKDEAARVRTYGKPEYLRGRTTIRDPYLHFKNTKRGVAAKSSLTNLNESARSREGRSRSPPRHGPEPLIDPMPRQFYFSPTRGYIPLGGGDTAPIQGQLVSMAIPLGAPRMESGVRRSAAPVARSSSGPVSSTPVPVTAARNVAMVSFPVDKDEQGRAERQPELTKQVLPPVDIDSISPSSLQRSDIHFRSPEQDNANLTFLFDSRNEADESKLPHTEDNSELEQSGEGIKLPGYEPKTAPYSGPNFPPQIRNPGWAAGGGEVVAAQQMSDVMADDLRRRDMLESNAVIWLEQELMARVLSQVPQQVAERPADVSQAESEVSDKDESLLVTDMIGQSGMQLFIDAGQPVDNALVQELIKVVIREKILAMMAQRETEGEGQVRIRNEVEEALEEKEAEEVSTGSHRVPTPQPTPEPSPIPFPKQTRQQPPQPATPPQSPPLDGYRFKPQEPEPPKSPEPIRQPEATAEPSRVLTIVESESESSLSLDISEELRRVTVKGKPVEAEKMAVVCHDVATPPMSPPPLPAEEEKPEVFPERQATPPATPPVTKTPPRTRTPSPRRKEPVVEKEEEEVLQDEDLLEQPQPIRISVGVGDDRPLTTETQTQLPPSPPKRRLTPVSLVSETTSLSTESTTTDTVNEWISEGQWLLSYSEGQVVGAVNYEAIRKEIAGRGYEHIVDVSTASTLRDTEDLDLDVEGTRSEGEFLHGGFLDPERDPRLEVLAQLQKRTMHVQQFQSGPAQRVMSSTGRSVGEMSIGQVPPARVGAEQARKYGEHLQRGRGGRARSPSSTLEKNLEENYTYKNDTQHRRQELEQQHMRMQSPQQDTYSRTASPPQRPHSQTPSPQQQKRSRTPPQQHRRSHTPPLQHQQESAATRTRTQVQYQPVLSEGRPLSARGRTLPGKQGRRRSSDVRLSQTSDPGVRRSDSTFNSESLSRSADGDSFRRSANGFLTSSMKSRNSAVKKSVEFDLSGTQQSSKRGSRDLSEDIGHNHSAALTYTEDSLDEAELHRIGATAGTSSYTGTYRMSVTIPSGAEGEDSEISEIDLSSKSDK